VVGRTGKKIPTIPKIRDIKPITKNNIFAIFK
jgi:hypothetical protein